MYVALTSQIMRANPGINLESAKALAAEELERRVKNLIPRVLPERPRDWQDFSGAIPYAVGTCIALHFGLSVRWTWACVLGSVAAFVVRFVLRFLWIVWLLSKRINEKPEA